MDNPEYRVNQDGLYELTETDTTTGKTTVVPETEAMPEVHALFDFSGPSATLCRHGDPRTVAEAAKELNSANRENHTLSTNHMSPREFNQRVFASCQSKETIKALSFPPIDV